MHIRDVKPVLSVITYIWDIKKVIIYYVYDSNSLGGLLRYFLPYPCTVPQIQYLEGGGHNPDKIHF